MRSRFGLACLAALVVETVAAEPLLVQLDPAASRVEYHITHTLKDVTDVAGTPSGHVRLDTTAAGWSLEGYVTVDLRALVTGNDTRDRHVKSADYLEVEKFPAAEFRFLHAEADPKLAVASDSVAAVWIGRVRGPLLLHGVEHTLEVPVRLDAVPGRDGALRARGTFVLQLADFGIPQPKKFMLAAGKSVAVRVDLVFAP
jgi:polyisoprenoid-binding protein YceI